MISSYISKNNFLGKHHEPFLVSSWVYNTDIINFEVTWACLHHRDFECSFNLLTAVVVLEEVNYADVINVVATGAFDLVRHVTRLSH